MYDRVLIACVCCIALFFTSGCGENETNPTDSSALSESYYPTTKGSFWKIKISGKEERRTITAIGDTTIAGKVYGALASSDGVKSFVRHDNGDIYVRGVHRNTDIEVIYAKISAGIGEKWNFSLPAFEGEYIYNCTLLAKGTTKVVLNKEYKNVVHIRYERSLVKDGKTVPDGGMEVYWAQGVGPIVTTSLDDGSTEWELEEYSIK